MKMSIRKEHLLCSPLAFALFAAGQFNSLFNDAIAPAMDDRLHFTGEATSVHHAWVVGALNSAYRTVVEILMTLPDGDFQSAHS
jgi:monoamine oxidase